MTILWDKKTRCFIRAKSNMCGLLAGLCGNFNSIQDDDRWAPDGITHEDVYEFSSLWQVCCKFDISFYCKHIFDCHITDGNQLLIPIMYEQFIYKILYYDILLLVILRFALISFL